MRDKVFFDLETTGVDVTNDRIVEISLVKVDSDLKVIDHFTSLINPTIPIPQGASDVHGITDEQIESAPTFKKAGKMLFEFVDGCDLAGYNSNRFDIPLLVNEFARAGITLDVSDVNVIDVYQIETKFRPNTLEAVYKRHTGKDLGGAHSADVDTMATLEIFKSQLNKFNLPLKFNEIENMMLEGNKRLDLGGKLKYVDNKITWGFGKHVNETVSKAHSNYINWILGADFPSDLKIILKQYI